METGKIVMVLIFIVLVYYAYKDLRPFFIRKKRLKDYSKDEITTITDKLNNELCLKYNVPKPKWGLSDLSKGDFGYGSNPEDIDGAYVIEIRTILIDLDGIISRYDRLEDYIASFIHEFAHYMDHLELESKGLDYSEYYTKRTQFYEDRANELMTKLTHKIYHKYLSNGEV